MSTLGPYELNQIYCGECSAMMSKLPDNCIDLWITSPPYDKQRQYHGYTFDFEAIAKQLYRITKPGGIGVWVVADETKDGSESGTSFRQALGFMALGFNLHDTMIYEVAGTGAKGSHYSYWQAFEYMFVFSKGTVKSVNLLQDKPNLTSGNKTAPSPKAQLLGSRVKSNTYTTPEFGKRTNIWRYHAGKNKGFDQRNFEPAKSHDAPFPEALARDHIISWSNPGDIVLDPLAGSGTTAKQAKELGRQWLGFDISPEYVELANRRVGFGRVPLFTM